jgi:MFS family permease
MANMWYLGRCFILFYFSKFGFYNVDHGRLTHSRLTAWNLGWVCTKTEQLIAFRFLAGLGGSAAISVRIDSRVWPVQHSFTRTLDPRRLDFGHMGLGGKRDGDGLVLLAPLLGPVIGPMTGAWIAEKSRWQGVFWSTSVFDGFEPDPGFPLLEREYVFRLHICKVTNHPWP